MSASYYALQLGLLQWKLKTCQQSVWSDNPGSPTKGIHDIGDLLDEVRDALRAFTNRATRRQAESMLKRIEKRHRFITDQNVAEWFSVVEREKDQKRRRDLYHEYLVDETNHVFREWQKKDRRCLQELLAALVAPHKRLEGYYEIGTRFGEAVDQLTDTFRPLSQKSREYVLAGLTKLPLRERMEIESKRLRIFVPKRVDIGGLNKQIKKLARYLKFNENMLVAKPKWDGRMISYRGQSKEVKIQENSFIGPILEEGEKQKWADSFQIPKKIQIRKKNNVIEIVVKPRNIANAIDHFERQQGIMEFSMNSGGLMWGPPGTVKRKPKGIARKKKK